MRRDREQTDQDISVRTGNGVVTITIQRPSKRNALSQAMYVALADAINAASADPQVRVIVLTGSSGSFTAGNDLADFLSDRDPGPVRRFQSAMRAAPAVMIAAVDGPAVGIGATMLLHCDLVYATERSYLLFPFVDLGLAPEFASSLLLPRLVGIQRAAEILLLGDRVPAARAAELGLVTEVLADVEAMEGRLAEQVGKLLAKPAHALRAIKALLRDDGSQTVDDRLDVEAARFENLLTTEETTARIAKVLGR